MGTVPWRGLLLSVTLCWTASHAISTHPSLQSAWHTLSTTLTSHPLYTRHVATSPYRWALPLLLLLALQLLVFAVRLLLGLRALCCDRLELRNTFAEQVRAGHATPDLPGKVEGLAPPLPNGWFRACDSEDITPGGAPVTAVVCERHLVVYRGADGRARAMDAFCPHLGAHLGVGGRVKGNALICPFHAWEFDGASGECVSIPYAQDPCKRPGPQYNTRAWTVFEANGIVHVWRHADGDPPHWYPTDYAEHGLRAHGRSLEDVRTHIQDIAENGADIAHFNVLHDAFVLPSLSRVFKHVWTARWRTDKSHIAQLTVTHDLHCLGRRVPGTHVHTEIDQVGPGLVNLMYSIPLFGKVLLCQSVTPVTRQHCVFYHRVWAERWVPRLLAKFVLWSTVVQTEKDIPVWNNKTYQHRPAVAREDGPILQYRRWFRQFYSKSEPVIRVYAEDDELREKAGQWVGVGVSRNEFKQTEECAVVQVADGASKASTSSLTFSSSSPSPVPAQEENGMRQRPRTRSRSRARAAEGLSDW